MKTFRLALLAPVLWVACDDSFVKGWLVERTRVLGVRIEASSEPARASVASGERAKVTWLIGAPNGTGPIEWTFAVCAPPIGVFPEARCESPVLASDSGASEGELVPMDLVVPAAGAIGDARELLLLAAFCEGGAPALDPGKFEATCAGGAGALLASATIRLAAAGPNRNPEIAPDDVRFDGEAMPLSTARVGRPCAMGESPIVAAGTKHTLAFRFRSEDREPLPEADGVETLIASLVTTAGELDRQYSAWEPEETAPKEVAIPWSAPPGDEASSDGRLVELYFVLRDGRGGLAFTRRTVCVRTP